jgi:hypothetical protein
MTDPRERPVLLWGSVATGKSGVLGALYDLGLSQLPTQAWSLSPGDAPPQVTEHLVSLRNGLLEGQSNPTAIQAHYPTLNLMVRKRRAGRTYAKLPLSFVDPAGEFADNVQRLRDSGSDLLQRMLDARGIVWLFDATRPGVDHDAIFGQLTTLTGLTDGALLQTPIALCLSKIDLLEPDALARVQQDPERALREHIGQDNYHLFSCVFANRESFAISSRGTVPGAIKPIGLNEVFDWIHDREQRKAMAASIKRNRTRALKVAGIGALLVAGVYGVASAYADMRDKAAQRELEQLGRLERAGAEYRDGNQEAVVSLLSGDALPPRHPRAIEWDTLYAFAASDLGLSLRAAGSRADSLMRQVMTRADRALASTSITDTEAIARLRFARAQVCGALQCGRRRTLEDLQWVDANTEDRGLKRRAREAMRELR